MAHSHFHSTEKHSEAGKDSLLSSVRRILTKGILMAIGLIALLSALLLAQPGSMAFASQAVPAAQSKPATNLSYYMTSGKTKIANALGCDQAKTDKRDGQESHVILDFGAQTSGGTGTLLIASGALITNKQIEQAVEAYAQGYSNCIGNTKRVTGVDIGTNNSGAGVGSANGKTWAKVVKAVRSYLSAHHLSAHVVVFGANDIESWGAPAAAIQWAKGYHSGNAGNYVNFGSLDGCPTAAAGTCAGGWTTADYWQVSNLSLAWVVPQIYTEAGTQAAQWERLDLYSVQHHNRALDFLGPLDQHNIKPGCCAGTNNTAPQAWNQLRSALNSHKSTAQKLLFSVEIRWEPTKA
jgi:hypothetical protein